MAITPIVRRTSADLEVTLKLQGVDYIFQIGDFIKFTAKSVLDNDPNDANAVIVVRKTVTVVDRTQILTLSPDDTDISEGIYVWDVRVTTASIESQVIQKGEFSIINTASNSIA